MFYVFSTNYQYQFYMGLSDKYENQLFVYNLKPKIELQIGHVCYDYQFRLQVLVNLKLEIINFIVELYKETNNCEMNSVQIIIQQLGILG